MEAGSAGKGSRFEGSKHAQKPALHPPVSIVRCGVAERLCRRHDRSFSVEGLFDVAF
jgi:hypothetical protein